MSGRVTKSWRKQTRHHLVTTCHPTPTSALATSCRQICTQHHATTFPHAPKQYPTDIAPGKHFKSHPLHSRHVVTSRHVRMSHDSPSAETYCGSCREREDEPPRLAATIDYQQRDYQRCRSSRPDSDHRGTMEIPRFLPYDGIPSGLPLKSARIDVDIGKQPSSVFRRRPPRDNSRFAGIPLRFVERHVSRPTIAMLP